MLSAGAQAVLVVASGWLGRGVQAGHGVHYLFYVVVVLYLTYGVAIGLAMPVKQGYLNAHIPSAQRATILSLDSMFANSGGVVGQSAWGWVARTRSIGEAWAWSGLTLLLAVPLYWMARRKDRRLDVIA
jgi:MFS family permease